MDTRGCSSIRFVERGVTCPFRRHYFHKVEPSLLSGPLCVALNGAAIASQDYTLAFKLFF